MTTEYGPSRTWLAFLVVGVILAVGGFVVFNDGMGEGNIEAQVVSACDLTRPYPCEDDDGSAGETEMMIGGTVTTVGAMMALGALIARPRRQLA